ncbi:MAG TPA: hypothetical protein VM120_07270 [Bryobacteraceae bacterium]|nr:hypothetical protein [Bryobacteraceae bacterium]
MNCKSLVALAAALMGQACSTRTESPPKVAYTQVDPSTAGVISGKVLVTGKMRPSRKVIMDEDPQCAGLHKIPVTDEPGAVFIHIKRGLEGKVFPPPAEPVTIDQRGCWFHPKVIGIQTGQTLKVTNSDPVTHNIHPRAQVNREWNQSQDAGSAPLTRRFARPETMIRVKCNIHGWMRAWIGVTDNPYFAVVQAGGTFEIGNVPPGSYTIEAWQEELGTQEQQVTVAPRGKPVVSFTFKGE